LLVAAGVVPFVDREEQGIGYWFGGRQGKAVVSVSVLVALVLTISMMWVAIGTAGTGLETPRLSSP